MLPLTTLVQEVNPQVQTKRLIKRLSAFAREKNLSELSINSHIVWVLRFLKFHNGQHPANLSQSDLELFISSLAIEHHYNQQIQSNAARTLMFLYRDFLRIKIDDLQFMQIKKRRGYIDRFGKQTCGSVIKHLQGSSRLMAELAVYCRLKLSQVVNLKLTDIDIKNNHINVKDVTNNIKFTAKIPIQLILDLRIQIMRARQLVQIKSRQFSNCYQKDVSQLSNKARLPTDDIQDEYLFPLANTANPQISSEKMQLILLKSDLKVAISRYFRLSCDLPNRNLTKLKPIQMSARLSHRDINAYDQKNAVFNITEQKQIPSKPSNESPKCAFDFRESTKQALELGAA